MFIGSINRYMRAVVETAAQGWRGRPVHVACSGNFTVERILARCGLGPKGVGAIHSNDVSIYSCALGWHLRGEPKPYTVKQPEFAWLADFLAPGLPTVATLLLAGEMLKAGKDSAYAQRMRAEYRRRWPELHAKTIERVSKALVQLAISCDTGIHSRRPMVFSWNCNSLPWNGTVFPRLCGSSEGRQGFIDEPERSCWRPKASRSRQWPRPSAHADLV